MPYCTVLYCIASHCILLRCMWPCLNNTDISAAIWGGDMEKRAHVQLLFDKRETVDFSAMHVYACGPKTAHARRVFLMDGVGWRGVGQDVTVVWTSAHTWCYATDIFSRLSYIFHATLGWGWVGWGKMLPSCELLRILDATLPTSSLDFHTSFMLRWGGVGWGGARCYRRVNFCAYLMLRYRHLL